MAKSLKIKAYFQIMTIYWVILNIFLTCMSFEFSFQWIIMQILFYTCLIINIIFYPWFRLFVSYAPILKHLFPHSLDRGMLSYSKAACKASILAYQETDYDRSIFIDKYGQVHQNTDSYSKRQAASEIFVINMIALPIIRFVVLNALGIFSFIFGWFYTPWCFNKITEYNKKQSEKA